MKKPTATLRRRQIRAALREAWKRKTRYWCGEWYGNEVRGENAFFPRTKARSERTPLSIVRLAGPLSLVTAPTFVLAKLRRLDETRKEVMRWGRVFVDITDVDAVDAAGLLYLCSRVRLLTTRANARVHGNYPKAEAVLRALKEANFHGFMTGLQSPETDRPQYLRLVHGGAESDDRRVRPENALRIQTFLKTRVPNLTQHDLDMVFMATGECLENVRVHAYMDRRRRREWYVAGVVDEQLSVVRVAILDVGVGIIRATPRLAGESDLDVLEAATLGRSRSSMSYRGQGLSTLTTFVRSAPGRVLHVLSQDGMVSWSDQGCVRQKIPTLEGSIVCLEISPTQVSP